VTSPPRDSEPDLSGAFPVFYVPVPVPLSFMPSLLFGYFCLSSGLALKPFLLFLLTEQGLCLSASSGYFSLITLIVGIREVGNGSRNKKHSGKDSG